MRVIVSAAFLSSPLPFEQSYLKRVVLQLGSSGEFGSQPLELLPHLQRILTVHSSQFRVLQLKEHHFQHFLLALPVTAFCKPVLEATQRGDYDFFADSFQYWLAL